MDARPSLTVAIPTFNGSRHLAEALRGILGQEGVSFDLVVSDDRSTDDTLDRVRAVAGNRARVVVNAERLGLAGNWNRCVSMSRTPLVAVVHQDDVLRPGHLAAHARAFEADPFVGLIASASGVIDDAGAAVKSSVVDPGGLGPRNRTFGAGEAMAMLATGNPFRCSAVTIRAEAHADVGGFDPGYHYVVDWEFWARVARRWPLAWLATPTVDVRWHLASETHRFATGTADLEEIQRLQESLLAGLRLDPKATLGVVREGQRLLSRAYLNRAHVALRGGNGALGRACLLRSIGLRPRILTTIAADLRLAAQMAAVWVAPGASGRWFRRQP